MKYARLSNLAKVAGDDFFGHRIVTALRTATCDAASSLRCPDGRVLEGRPDAVSGIR